MAISLLFNLLQRGRRVAIGDLQLDATLEERHEYANQVTTHPVETGGSIEDHVYLEPVRVRIEGEVTDSPVRILGGLVGQTERRLEAWETLRDLERSRQPVTLVTGYDVYDNMLLTRLLTPRDRETGKRLLFTAEFIQLSRVRTETVAIPAEIVDEAQADLATSEQNAGKQSTSAASEAESGAGSSLLFDVFGLGGG